MAFMNETLFYQILYGWIALAFIVFAFNLRIVAPYGRHASASWGPLLSSRLAWMVMESPVLVLMLYFAWRHYQELSAVVWWLFFLFVAHYFHRTFIFPFRIRNSKKVPLGIVVLAIIFNLFNGFFIGYYLTHYAHYPADWWFSWPFITGTLLFAAGAYINWRADTMLINLRNGNSTGYRIPRGFLFEYVSCPNHFGEMLEWLGYALMSFSLPALAFALWTMANLIPRALAHHRWYLQHFDDYPAGRKAFLPGIW